MYYEINVSHKGKHLFATAPRSITSEVDLAKVLTIMVERFPKRDGYEVDASCWQHTGHSIDVAETIKRGKRHAKV